MIGQTISHYRVLEKLGEGGMGVVYAAEDSHLGRQVAIKLLQSNSNGHHFRARFMREARAISALSHPNIATIYDGGETEDGQPFIVMELIQGKTLSDLLNESALTLSSALSIIESVADALSAAHHHCIVHRDIKPSNIMINDRGQVKVLDFGLAKHLSETHSSTNADPQARTLLATQTQSGVVVGTPLYLSPEQATGQPVDARSDLFALGAVLYECVTGRAAFSGASVLEIGAQVIHVDPVKPSRLNSRVSGEMDKVVMKALAKKAVERYQTAEEMLFDLRRLHRSLSEEDSHRTIRLPAMHRIVNSPSALMTISEKLRRPRLSIGFMLIIMALSVLTVWGVTHWWPRFTYKPSEKAKYWYDQGIGALRNGAYYQASKALEEAVKADDKYPLTHARLAEAYMELDYADLAKDELLRVNSLVPDRSVLSTVNALYLEAINAVATRDFPHAIEAYRKIASLTPNEAQVHVDLGRAYEKNNESNKAIESYLEATNRDPQYATPYLRLASLYARNQDTPSAIKALDMAESLFQSSSNVEGRTEVLYQRGKLFRDWNRLPESRMQLQQALDTARAYGNESQQIKILLQLGRLSYSEGESAREQKYAQEALDFAQQKGLENLVSSGLHERAWSFYANGDYGEAEKDFRQSLDFAERNRLAYLEAANFYGLGSILIQQLRTDEGLEDVKRALSYFQANNYRQDISFCLSTFGRGNRRKGDYDTALQAFQQKRQLAEQANDQREIAFTDADIATVHLEQGRYPEAFKEYDNAYVIYKSLGGRQNLAYTLMNRGNVLWRLGRYDEAAKSLDQSLDLANQPDSPYKQVKAEIQTIKAQIALSQRRFPDAVSLSKQALELAGTKYKELAVDAKYVLGLALVFSGKEREGRQSCEEAVMLASSAGDFWRLSNALLALAEAQFDSSDAQAAVNTALQAQQRFAMKGQRELEWRAGLTAALASHRQGDESTSQAQMARASEVLSQLQQEWGDEAFNKYLARPDIQFAHKQLGGALSADTKTSLTR